jgi:16S rRNA (guanine966-N2)-methyltransferase
MRIIGGSAGGRILKAPRGVHTRPTSDKVRQAIFNVLAARMEPPARVLDLYAGSGALGLEALSRGAGAATFVDEERDSCALARENGAALGFPVEVVHSPVVRWLAKQPEAGPPYGWIFLDPPYGSHATGELDKALDLIARRGLLGDEGVAVAEHEWRHPPAERYQTLALLQRRRYGQTTVSFYTREQSNG